MRRLVVAWKYLTEAFLFLLYVRKDQVQEKSSYKLWFLCNNQENDYLNDFSNSNNVSFLDFISNIYVAYFDFY